jgi:hypothetical protein
VLPERKIVLKVIHDWSKSKLMINTSLRSCFRNSVSYKPGCVPPLIRGGQEGFAAAAFVYSHFYRHHPLIPSYQRGKLVPETF